MVVGMSKASPRPGRLEVEVEVTLESDHNFYTGFTHNISAGGLFIATEQIFSVGTELSVRFALQGESSPIEAEVIVRWVRESGTPGMGVQFISLPEVASRAINGFLTKRETIFYDHDE